MWNFDTKFSFFVLALIYSVKVLIAGAGDRGRQKIRKSKPFLLRRRMHWAKVMLRLITTLPRIFVHPCVNLTRIAFAFQHHLAYPSVTEVAAARAVPTGRHRTNRFEF